MRIRSSLLALAAAAGLAASAGALAQFGGAGAQDDRGVLASLVSRALSTPATRVSIGAVDGALSSDATIRDIEISDRDGVWLRLDRARIVWRRLALFQRRLEIDRLEIGTLDIRRRAIPAEEPVAGEDQPLLPELPVKVEIKAFTLSELRIGEPILGTDARLAATGTARLGNDPKEGLDLAFDARRLDAAGTLTARLGYVPQGQRLALKLVVDEPAGGVAARLAGIPGLPPVRLDLDGQGPLDAFRSRLTFDAGAGIGASGAANLDRDGTARRLGLDIQARIDGLLPPVVAPVFAGVTRILGSAVISDDGAVTLPGFVLNAALATVTIKGQLDRNQVANLSLTAANLPAAPGAATPADAELRRLALDARLTGPLTGPNVEAKLALEGLRTAWGRVGRLDATATATPDGLAPGGATLLRLVADARASGLVPVDRAIARALGETATLSFRGTATTQGVVEAGPLTITASNIGLRYEGRIASDELRGRLAVEAASLRPFSDLAGTSLAGEANVAADLEGTPRANRINATIDGRIAGFATGLAPIDGLFGGRLGLAGTIRVEPTGGYAVQDLRLTGAFANARVDGRLAPDAADLAVVAEVQDLKRVDARLTGRADATARLTGTLARPDATARIAVRDATAIGRPVPRLSLDVVGRDLLASPDLRLALDGEVDRRPAKGSLRVTRPAGGGYTVDALDLTVGSVRAEGSVSIDERYLAKGALKVRAGNLDDLSALLMTKAAGSLTADVTLDSQGGGQGARVLAEARRIAVAGVTVAKLDADLTLADLYRRPLISGQARIDEASVAGERITRLRLDAKGTPLASDVTLSAVARGFDLDARARVVPGERIRIEVSDLAARRGGERLALAGPATLTVVEGGVDLKGVAVAFGSGRLTVDGLVGSRLDLTAAARTVPLSAAAIVLPGLGLAGTLDGSARITGTAAAPSGEYRARIDGLAAPQTRSLGLPPATVTASGRLTGGRATLASEVAAGRAGSVRLSGSLPVDGAGALDLAVRGEIDAGAATAGILAAGGRRLSGRLAVDARIGGTLAAPAAGGSATLAGGVFTDATLGVQLNDIRARIVARGDEATIESASATTRNGGSVTASGRVRLDPGAGFPGEVRIGGSNAELVRSGVVTAVANLALTLSGPLARDPRVAGRIDLVGADVAVPEQLPGSLRPLPNTRHLNPTPTTRARLALSAKQAGKGGRAAPTFDARLDLTLSAPGRIFVRGRGLNAELGGSLRLTGTLGRPVANGAFALARGTFQLATTRLDFSRGRLTFSGDLTPELDFVATTNAGGAEIQAAVSGPASNPSFSFTSSPDLPQDEVLSRLLFNSPSGQLSAFQALALAQTASQFSGGEGSGPFEGLRRSLGLSGFDVGFGSGGPGAGLQRALGNRVNVGVKAGPSAAATGVGVDVKITDEIRLQGEVGAGGSSVGVGAQYEW